MAVLGPAFTSTKSSEKDELDLRHVGKIQLDATLKGLFLTRSPGGGGVEEVGDGAASEWAGHRWVVELLCNPLRKVITTSQDS